MSLHDLREELARRAAEVDHRAPDLLPGLSGRIRRTRRRRIAVGAAAALIAAATLIPGLTTSSVQDPARDVPRDYTRDGVTLRGMVGASPLERAWIGAPGETHAEFTWTPKSREVALMPICRGEEVRSLWIRVNDRTWWRGQCGTTQETPVPMDSRSSIWQDTEVGEPARVTVQLVAPDGELIRESAAQLAVGIYTEQSKVTGLPAQTGDYVRGSIRFPARLGGETLLAARTGDPGENQLNLSVTPKGRRLVLLGYNDARDFVFHSSYQLRAKINGVERLVDPVDDPGSELMTVEPYEVARAGARLDITVRLTDATGRTVSVPKARIGLGVYQKGAERVLGPGDLRLDEILEYENVRYRLAEVRTAAVARAGRVTIRTPEGKPYLLAYGSSELGAADPGALTLSGVPHDATVMRTGEPGATGGFALLVQEGRDAATAVLTVNGKPKKGTLALGVYLPE